MNSKAWDKLFLILFGATVGNGVTTIITVSIVDSIPIWYIFIPLVFVGLQYLAFRYKWKAVEREWVAQKIQVLKL